jgi:hypothetical protein
MSKELKPDTIEQILFRYSEWLDGEGLVKGEQDSKDGRSHEELVADFLTVD